ncbi:hypothetical protein [Lacrimispora sp.]|uniref:hypothetical protein n=1 Tax=Lacrimispora sp. TaxID=2719234 RepID=UPI0028B26158|nr:hypothetical protein [Lacrimispora sp.]
MGKNADTIKMGGNRQDCGPSVLKKVSKNEPEFDPGVFIKTKPDNSTFINGFEASLKSMNFK